MTTANEGTSVRIGRSVPVPGARSGSGRFRLSRPDSKAGPHLWFGVLAVTVAMLALAVPGSASANASCLSQCGLLSGPSATAMGSETACNLLTMAGAPGAGDRLRTSFTTQTLGAQAASAVPSTAVAPSEGVRPLGAYPAVTAARDPSSASSSQGYGVGGSSGSSGSGGSSSGASGASSSASEPSAAPLVPGLLGSLGVLVLHARITSSNTLACGTRRRLHAFVEAHSGVSYSELRRAFGVANGVLSYHLRILEELGWIRSIRSGSRRRYFSGMHGLPPVSTLLPTVQGSLLETLQRTPGLSQAELARRLRLARQAVSYNMRRLVRLGFVRRTSPALRSAYAPAGPRLTSWDARDGEGTR